MIDTVRLAYDTKTIPEEFKFVQMKNGVFKGVINPTKIMKVSGKYYPRITCIKRPVGYGNYKCQILVEFSVPKLLMGNNFSEVCDTDFDAVVQILRHRLFEMGIKWQFSACIKQYRVVKADYSKNIIYEDGTSISQILRLLNSANIRRSLDVSAGDFRNGGQILHFHTGYRDIVFYDKIADLKRSKISEKRCEEKDSFIQRSLFDLFEEKKQLSVLRFEIRLNGVKEIKSNLVKIGQDADDLSFERMFSSDISRNILLYWWNEIFSRIPKAPLDNETIENVFLGLLNNPDAKPQKVLATLGVICLQRSHNYDARFIKELFDKRFCNGSWVRSNKALIVQKSPNNLQHLLYIEDAIKEMKPINIDDYKDRIV